MSKIMDNNLSNKSCIKPQQKTRGKGYGIFYVDYSRDIYGEIRGPYHGVITSKKTAITALHDVSLTLRRPVQVKQITWTIN